jgi:hypothetical protein
MKFKRLLIIGSVFFALLTACKKEIIPNDNIQLGKEYFPITKDHTIEYAIDSIIYNDFNKSTDTFRMQFKDVIGESFYDNEGRESYVVNRYSRQDDTYLWKDLMTFYATKTNFRVEVVENNLRMIKLVFPVKLKTYWAGNIYIPAQIDDKLKWLWNWNYTYTYINQPFNTGLASFSNTIEVIGINDSTNNPEQFPDAIANKTYSKEVYAKNVGLIYRELTNWEYQPDGSRYRNGFTTIYRAIRSY